MGPAASSGMLCSARTSKGFRCINKAGPEGLCPSHDPRRWCGAETESLRPCKRAKGPGGGPCHIHK